MSRWCSPKIIHNIHGNQANSNTKIRYWPQFQGYRGKTLSFKSSTTKQNFLELPSVLQCKQSASTCKGPTSEKSNSRSTSSSETKILLFKLDQTYRRSEYRKYSSRIRDSLSRKPCAGKDTQPSSFKSRTIQVCQGGTQGNVVERCNTASITMQKSISQQPLSCIKEGWGQQTSNNFEASEQFHPIPAIQNGGTEFTTKYAPEGRLHVHTGPKRRLLLCSSKKGIIKVICKVSVGRDTLRVPLSLSWSRFSSSNIYQNLEGTNFTLEKASDSCDNIFGHVTHVTDTRRVINEQRYNNFSSDSIGICNQFEKVYSSAIPTNRIFRLADSKKGGGDCSDVSKCNRRQFDFKGFDKVTGETDFHNSSNFTSETSDSFPAADTNTGPEKKT